MKHDLSMIRLWLAVGLGALLAIFAIQNSAQVRLSFLFWDWESRRIVVIALSFFIGLTIGWLLKGRHSGRATSDARAKEKKAGNDGHP